jgi:hypothetical protein
MQLTNNTLTACFTILRIIIIHVCVKIFVMARFICMFKKSIKYYFLIFLVVLLPLSACGPKYKAAKSRRQLEKRMEQRRLQGENALREGQKRHYKIQGRDAQKRMKETRKKSDRLNKKRKDPFYIRWFTSSGRR